MNRHEKMKAIALINPFKSVDQKFDIKTNVDDEFNYLGVKNVVQVPKSLIKKLRKTGNYGLHTLDKCSHGGRAIDLNLINPITGNAMSGSSSGTAINVFLGINDIGIGADGGGSVLAPAMSLNLFGFISPLIESDYMSTFSKRSTDNIQFSPSIGFITHSFKKMDEIITDTLEINVEADQIKTVIASEDLHYYDFPVHQIQFPDIYGERLPLIEFLNKELPKCDVLISYEGPVDLHGFGDSVFGHFDTETQMIQRAACKGLIRVVNMANATALCIPDKGLAKGFVLISESSNEKISKMIRLASSLITEEDELITRYFRNLDLYFTEKFDQDEEDLK